MLKYSLEITWSDKDGGYIAIIPELNNLSAFGRTYDEVVAESQISMGNFLETLKLEGIDAPQPSILED